MPSGHHRSARINVQSLRLVLGIFAAFAGGCGHSTPVAPVSPPSLAPVAVATPTPRPAIPGYSDVCSAIGYGSGNSDCGGGESAFLGDVADAIDALVAQKPQFFNLKATDPGGGVKVTDVDSYYQGVIDLLGKKGLCAAPSFGRDTLLVKQTNEFSETFAILTSHDYTRRGSGVFAARCSPAEFPLTAEDAIDYLRVAFYGFNCPADVIPPPPPLGQLPLACFGLVTATPKDRNGKDVPAFIHGPDITWDLISGDGVVALRAIPEIPFNYAVQAQGLGRFTLCATVKGFTGCLDGRVIRSP